MRIIRAPKNPKTLHSKPKSTTGFASMTRPNCEDDKKVIIATVAKLKNCSYKEAGRLVEFELMGDDVLLNWLTPPPSQSDFCKTADHLFGSKVKVLWTRELDSLAPPDNRWDGCPYLSHRLENPRMYEAELEAAGIHPVSPLYPSHVIVYDRDKLTMRATVTLRSRFSAKAEYESLLGAERRRYIMMCTRSLCARPCDSALRCCGATRT